eukprot:gene8500-11492_t
MISNYWLCPILVNIIIHWHFTHAYDNDSHHLRKLNEQVINSKPKYYIYEWPHLMNRYANRSDRSHGHHGVEFPHWYSQYGAGRIMNRTEHEHKTSQFSLFKIMIERLQLDESRRTFDPNLATTFIIPYDIGMDATFTESNGRMRRTGCPIAKEVIPLLQSSSYFNKNNGYNHLLINSLSIDDYMFVSKDRSFEMKNRGINWHAVPFPSDYHYNMNITAPILPPWERATFPRLLHNNQQIIISFLGTTKVFNQVSTSIREALVLQCNNHSDICKHVEYYHEYDRSQHIISRDSIFCLQPPGNLPTRKSVFDSILSGCIPVFFHPLTAKLMYEWHINQSQWEEIAIHYDSYEENQELLSGSTDFINKLYMIYLNNPKEIIRKQELIKQIGFQLQYSLIIKMNSIPTVSTKINPHTHLKLYDAYDVSIENVLKIHIGLKKQDRISHYATCLQIDGTHNTLLQTFDWCNSTKSNIDPFYPPALISI